MSARKTRRAFYSLFFLANAAGTRPDETKSLIEVTQALKTVKLLDETKKNQILFDLLDKDNSGYLDSNEWSWNVFAKKNVSGGAPGTDRSECPNPCKGTSCVKQEFVDKMQGRQISTDDQWEPGDAKIGYDRLKEMKFNGETTGGTLDALFSFWDSDGDGEITSTEFVIRNAALSDLDMNWKLDTDELLHLLPNLLRFPFMAGSDGLLSREEVVSSPSTLVGSVTDYVQFSK